MILITGANGFIGSAVQRELDQHQIEYRTLDITGDVDYRLNLGAKYWHLSFDEAPSAVIHLAGLLGTGELMEADAAHDAIDVNIHGTLAMLEVCRELNIPFVGVTMEHVWVNIYETTKLAAERMAEAYHREYGFPVRFVRAYNVFGPRQAVGEGHPQKMVPTFAVGCWQGRKDLPIWAPGSQRVDIVHVSHIARQLRELATNDTLPDYFYVDGGTGVVDSVQAVAFRIAQIVRTHQGPIGEFEYVPTRPGEHEPSRYPFAQGMGWVEMGWQPPRDYQELVDTVLWYRDEAHWQYPPRNTG
jgi:nucleoside-diphosphate-sugar epimerase